ncbi:MAG: hypothetical protein QOG42_1200 [Solirubrobacteraceae bacterium]|nr:hypothetical protein [Solirubrobacteraceae bacterium]
MHVRARSAHGRRNPARTVLRAVTPILIGFALLFGGCGDGQGGGGGAARVSPVDRAFVAGMVPHHKAAVQMAQTAQRRASSAFVTRLAANILRTQRAEISLMRGADRRLAAAGIAVGSLGVAKSRMAHGSRPGDAAHRQAI